MSLLPDEQEDDILHDPMHFYILLMQSSGQRKWLKQSSWKWECSPVAKERVLLVPSYPQKLWCISSAQELYPCVLFCFSTLRGLKDPRSFIDFLKSADISLVRLEFLLELHQDGLAMPRRQEAETMCTKSGATALVTLEEYEKLLVNDNTGMLCSIVCLMLLMRLGYLEYLGYFTWFCHVSIVWTADR